MEKTVTITSDDILVSKNFRLLKDCVQNSSFTVKNKDLLHFIFILVRQTA